jgi:RHS repeat-associated protein
MTPTANQTLIDFQKDSGSTSNFYETQRQVFQGSTSGTLLLTANTCYGGSASPCTSTTVTSPISSVAVVSILPGTSNLQSKRSSSYSQAYGLLLEADDYDYGSGAPPASPSRKTVISYASLGNGIVDMPASVTIQDGSGATKAQTTYTYDQGTPTPTSNTPQHVAVSGSRGNPTTIAKLVQGSTTLAETFTYYDTGNVQTFTDVNGGQVTYTYGACGNSFPTGISEPVSLSRSLTWDSTCAGGVQLTATDENSKITTAAYANDPFYWRPDSVTDPTGAAVSFCYGLLSSSTGTCTRNISQVESTVNFNSNNSTVDTLTAFDGLGRTHIQQRRKSPTATTFDSVETDYDSLGRVSRVTLPYSGTAGQTCPSGPSCPAAITSYDALSRLSQVTNAGGGSTAYSPYSNNDVVITVGPAPSGENTKRRQLEYDALGRLTSVCEITGLSQSGACGQTTTQTGFWSKYVYDTLSNLTGVTQNAQPNGTAQTRSYSYDGLSRLTSETNPESGTTNYTYDTDATCGTSSGDLVKRVDTIGNTNCNAYDTLHRKISATYPSGQYASPTTSNKYFVYDTATVNSISMLNAKTRVAEAFTATCQTCSKITDEGFSYTARGEVSDVYQTTPNSGGYYHVNQTYWAHGLPSQLSQLSGLPTISYGGTIGSTVGLDGEGRVTQVTASSGQNPVIGTNYNLSTLPTQVNFGSGDSDIFAYDSNTLRMTQYQFSVNGQSAAGVLTWNANSTLQTLVITDPFNAADAQTCNYGYDDVVRLTSANCGTVWSQTFSYDPFGNINKTGNPGMSFTPFYSSSTNRITSFPGGFTATYDNNGNVTNDSNHTYTWDADGNSITIDGVGLTFDALDRMVEKNASGTFTEIVYAPTSDRLALMSGQTLQKAFIPLPGQATAVYTGSGLDHYRHSDWLGSSRLTSTPSRTVASTVAYAPFGETYAQSGTPDVSLTGQNQDTVSDDYDFLFREYSTQGRWPSPDPAGLAAVSLANPQSWNRYAYVLNNPLGFVDPLGLYCVYYSDDGVTVESIDGNSSPGECEATGGVWIDPPVETVYVTADPIDPYDPSNSGIDLSYHFQLFPGLKGGGTFGQCMAQHAGNYSMAGAAVTIAGGNQTAMEAGNLVAGNMFLDAFEAAKLGVPALAKGMGAPLTWGRRSSDIMAMNLAGKGGLPQALSASGKSARSLLGKLDKALSLGLTLTERAIIDGAFVAGEAIACSH